MYNKKSKVSAILTIIAAVVLVGLLILLLTLKPEVTDGDLGSGIAAGFSVIFFVLGCIITYAGAIPFVTVALVFGIRMLKQQSRNKLISLNKRMLITTCVLLPVLVIGTVFNVPLMSSSTLGVFPVIFTIVTALVYVAGLVAQIVAVVLLKKSPEESVSDVAE